jgi:hypothetical protein
MGNNRSLIISIVLFLIFIIIAFSLSGGKKKIKTINKNTAKNLLLSGGPTEESLRCANTPGCVDRRSAKSLFDCDPNDKSCFGNTSGVVYLDEETKTASAEGENPMNPQTGKPYDDEAMEQFNELKKLFPTNDLIPKKMTKDDLEKKKVNDERLMKAMNAVAAGKFTREDAIFHYDNQIKNTKDRIEIIEYLIQSQKDDGEVDKDGQFQKILDSTKEQLKQVEAQKSEALTKSSG